MSITVRDILSLKVFDGAELLTNKSSTDRIIRSVSVSDCPIYEELIEENIFAKGDFFLSTLSLYVDDEEALLEFIRIMIKAESSGLCVTDDHYSDFPEAVLELCNRQSFPIIRIHKNIPYAVVIREITETLISSQSHLIKINTVNELLNSNASGNHKLELIRKLNPHFGHYFMAFYIVDVGSIHVNTFIQSINESATNFAIPYLNGVLGVLSFQENIAERVDRRFKEHTQYFIQQAKDLGDMVIGVSGKHSGIINIDIAIGESMFASKTSQYTSNRILYYDQIGSIRLLMALQDHRELINYYDLTINKIIKYDKTYNLKLLETLKVFVRNDGDYKRTAHDLDQHENTIRYRINKVKAILNLEYSNLQFYETISLGLKVYDMLN